MKDEASACDPSAGLACGVLLTFVGGYLDAFTYIGYGGRFANTQSGNCMSTLLQYRPCLSPIHTLMLFTRWGANGTFEAFSPRPWGLLVSRLASVGAEVVSKNRVYRGR
jgi:hypothetical protein